MTIGPKSIEIMKALVSEQLDTFSSKIGEALLKSEDGKLKVSISLDISPSEIQRGALDIDATISFTAEKVKYKVSKTVSENQTDLLDALIPKPGSGIESVTVSSGGRSVTLSKK